MLIPIGPKINLKRSTKEYECCEFFQPKGNPYYVDMILRIFNPFPAFVDKFTTEIYVVSLTYERLPLPHAVNVVYGCP